MSILTAQANHLREMAYTVERVKNDAVGKLSLSGSITLAMAAMDMRDAADTIARLRNTCNDLQFENAKLKALVRDMWDVALHPQLFGDGSHLRGRMESLGVEVDE